MSVITIVVTCVLAVVFLASFVVWSIKRHRDPHLRVQTDAPIETLIPSIAGLSLGTIVEGNSVELLENAAFFEVLIADIRSAKVSIHFETFLWSDGTLGRRLAAALSERARAGVQVRILLDAIGSKKVGSETEEQMKEAGCKVEWFHRRHIWNIGVLAERDHRKLVIIDGRIGFAGGHCIVDDWVNGKALDLSVKIRGPVVHTLQSVFSENWTGHTAELFLGDSFFPTLQPEGTVAAHVAYAKPEGSAPAVKILHHLVIGLAQKRLWIQNAYFIPEPAAINAFGDAVKRGVDVRVMTPSMTGSDNPMVQHAAHRNFEKLLKCGVRIYEYPKGLLHQKVMTIDGIWSAVGSSNFDDRSFETNDEITIGFKDKALAQQLESIFERYIPECKEVDLEEWRKRGLWLRAKEQAYYLINEVL
ncbi:MAG TPA: phospholipase D-like domain-containing protein [Burkholderiales bacterium]|jgi:cardiolipin synthase A/B|nr:phospholipase D-like domain-containing protein [Burkholderiales bacterium]